MFSHMTIGASDLPRAIAFYDVVLAPLGIERLSVKYATWASWPRAGPAHRGHHRSPLKPRRSRGPLLGAEPICHSGRAISASEARSERCEVRTTASKLLGGLEAGTNTTAWLVERGAKTQMRRRKIAFLGLPCGRPISGTIVHRT